MNKEDCAVQSQNKSLNKVSDINYKLITSCYLNELCQRFGASGS